MILPRHRDSAIPRQARNERLGDEELESVRLPGSSSWSRRGSILLPSPTLRCLQFLRTSIPFPMSATRLSSTSTTTSMPAYMGSLRLAAISEHGRIDKEFGSSPRAFSSSSPPPPSSDFAPSPSPYTVPPRGALVFQQHVHRILKPMRPSQKFRIWYRGIFWETLEPVSLISPPLRKGSTPRSPERRKKKRLGEAACRTLENPRPSAS